MIRLAPYIETNFAYEKGKGGRVRLNKRPWSLAAFNALRALEELQSDRILAYHDGQVFVPEGDPKLKDMKDSKVLSWIVDSSLKLGDNIEKGKRTESYSTPAEPFILTSSDLKELGFTGYEKLFRNDLFGGLYREGVVEVFLELSKLRKELLLLKDKLKDPSQWYSLEFDGKTLDSFELLEYLWNKLENYKDTLSNYPTYDIIKARELNFFDPSIKKSKVWSKIRGIGLRKPVKQELPKVEPSKTEETTRL